MAAEQPKARQRTRFDVDAARARYIALGPMDRSFARVAREFRVSSVTVRKHARLDEWVAKAADADRKAAEGAERAAARTVEQRMLKNALLHDRTADRLEQDVDDLGEPVLVRLLEITGKWARLDAGQATDRMEFSEIQAFVGAVVKSAGKWITDESRPASERLQAFLDEIRGAAEQHDGDQADAA